MSNVLEAVLSHKDFQFPSTIYFHNDVCSYAQKKIKTNLPFKKYKSEYDDRIFGELGIWKYLYENEDYEWYILHHYRRYLTLYANHFCIPEPIRFQTSLLQQTMACHSVKYAEIFKQVLEPNDFAILNSANFLIPYNMMAINKNLLKGWLEFVEFYINKMVNLLNIRTYEEAVNAVKNDESFTSNKLPNGQEIQGKNCDPVYQARIYAFALERLNTIFWLRNMNTLKPIYCQVMLLQDGQKI